MHENFPQPPWTLAGHFWSGLFRTDKPVQLPSGLRPLLGKFWAGVSLFRYSGSTLVYDELLIGIPVLVGLMPCLWIRDIWVNNEAALWGGRKIWAVPKSLATFTWSDRQVHIADNDGMVAVLALPEQRRLLPWVWFPFPILGTLDGRRVITVASVRGRLCRGGPSVVDWSNRLPFRIQPRPVLAFGSNSFQLRVPAPLREDSEAERPQRSYSC